MTVSVPEGCERASQRYGTAAVEWTDTVHFWPKPYVWRELMYTRWHVITFGPVGLLFIKFISSARSSDNFEYKTDRPTTCTVLREWRGQKFELLGCFEIFCELGLWSRVDWQLMTGWFVNIHGVTSKKHRVFINTAVRASNNEFKDFSHFYYPTNALNWVN